jgi:predicted transcriptional regulator
MPDTKAIANTISEAELDVLQQLWEQSPLSAQDIIRRLDGHPSTVKTLINRLLKKGAIGFHEKNRKYHYFPVIEKSDFYQLKTKSFLNRFFGGEVTPLVSFFSNHNKIDEKDLAELKQLIEKMEADHDD